MAFQGLSGSLKRRRFFRLTSSISTAREFHVGNGANNRVDFLCDLLDNPGVLAADSSPGRILAVTEALALPDSAARLGRDVDCRGSDHCTMAGGFFSLKINGAGFRRGFFFLLPALFKTLPLH